MMSTMSLFHVSGIQRAHSTTPTPSLRTVFFSHVQSTSTLVSSAVQITAGLVLGITIIIHTIFFYFILVFAVQQKFFYSVMLCLVTVLALKQEQSSLTVQIYVAVEASAVQHAIFADHQEPLSQLAGDSPEANFVVGRELLLCSLHAAQRQRSPWILLRLQQRQQLQQEQEQQQWHSGMHPKAVHELMRTSEAV